MQMTNDIRKVFLDYFARHGHQVVESSPLVPRNDPTLMFVNSGMVQFKNVFTGVETRDFQRATTSQKCVRAGGKHNDLENVGRTARHHTFFEMLGNFSFGDYFKDVAIDLAWNLVTKEYGLAGDRLLVTVYAEDDEAFELWKKIAGLPEGRILRIPTSDNFWAMGDTGPCGPCSEIFFDHGDHIPGGPPGSAEEDGDRFIEIWNLVFMQYEQVTTEKRIDLPKPSVDTGMGLERIAAVLQGTHDNYEIDLLRALIEASAEATQSDPDGEHKVSHRVIADHIRASSFLIADGVLPSNEGRGYVLRRIMRRAEPLITETLKLEEGRFKQTLKRGLGLLDKATASLGDGEELSGEVAFRLYDTYGFPLDLTQDALKGRSIAVDQAGFDAAMERQRAEARKAWAGSGEAATETIWFETRDDVGVSEFLGYDTETAEGLVVALVVDGKRVEEAAAGADVAVVMNQTPYYAESGGQTGDSGNMATAPGAPAAVRVTIADTQKKADDLYVHMGCVKEGTLKVGADLILRVDGDRRQTIRANHSATHLLHAALRRRLGEHVTQKGSLVAPDRLRFDISHPKPVAAEELIAVEAEVNAEIRRNTLVSTRLMDPDQAVEAGAMALFGEKYGDEVRVVSMGEGADAVFSTELCGGTHVGRTGDIGLFKIVSEGAVAAGVRRIEALTAGAAVDYLSARERILGQAAALLKAQPADVPGRVEGLLEERRHLERDLVETRRKLATGGVGAALEVKDIDGIKFSPQLLDDVPPKDLKGMADELKERIGSGVVALISVNEGRASLVVAVSEDLTARISAIDLVRAGSAAVGGKGGGGRADMAQAGGPDGGEAAKAVAAIEAALSQTA